MQSLVIIDAGCGKKRCKSRTKYTHPIQGCSSAHKNLKSGFQIFVTLREGGAGLHGMADRPVVLRNLRQGVWPLRNHYRHQTFWSVGPTGHGTGALSEGAQGLLDCG